MAGTHVCWHACSPRAGIALGRLRPLRLSFGTLMLPLFRPQHRREELMPAARRRAFQGRDALYHVMRAGRCDGCG